MITALAKQKSKIISRGMTEIEWNLILLHYQTGLQMKTGLELIRPFKCSTFTDSDSFIVPRREIGFLQPEHKHTRANTIKKYIIVIIQVHNQQAQTEMLLDGPIRATQRCG